MTSTMGADFTDLRGKSVLITGGLGFLGSNLAHQCVAAGANVTVYDCLDPQSGGNGNNLCGVDDRVGVICQDIRNFKTFAAAVKGRDILFHCAAYTSHIGSMHEPADYVDVNCNGVIQVLEAVRQVNPDIKVVHVGTSTQVGSMKAPEIDENHPEFPKDIYSASKTAGEKFALIYGESHGLRVTVIRLSNTFGPRAHIRSSRFGFMNFFIGLGLQQKEITVYGDGLQNRSISFVDDSVRALLMASLSERVNGEVLFAVDDRQVTVIDVAHAIASRIGGSVRNVPWPEEKKAVEVGDVRISNRKVRDMLGWYPVCSLESGLEQTRDFYSSRLDYYL